MKRTGITRQIDRLGRIVLPSELRRNMYLKDRSYVEIFTEDDMIILKKFENDSCIMCSSMEDLADNDGTKICKKCLTKMLNQVK